MEYNKYDYGRQYFRFVEHISASTKLKWIYLIDNTGVMWGMYSSYKKAKDAIRILVLKYGRDLEKRGTVNVQNHTK